ncbi:MAG: methenyltetrahydromethanopterin cyclohydrolase [Planctomycetaceae bacterium]|nr:methenyltetrahydromethanopterin cyclohydrolase [Planctomycetaceae bacterium]
MTSLNQRAARILRDCIARADELKIDFTTLGSCTVADFGVSTAGGLEAGRMLAEVCLSGLGTVELQTCGGAPAVVVRTDHPVRACLQSQYAGWKVSVDNYFAMGSGPMRATLSSEQIFQEMPVREEASECVGVLESGALPDAAVLEQLQQQLGEDRALMLAVAPTASQAGNIQVVARSVETALHKLHEIDFPIETVQSGYGTVPLPPVAKDDLTGIGRTNDAILYAGQVHLWVDCEDEVIEQFGPLTPSSASPSHGRKFLTLFKEANYDFYGLDKTLFSPAIVTFHNLTTGNSHTFGSAAPEIVQDSFGL